MSGQRMMKIKIRKAALILLCLMMAVGLAACGQPDDIDISGYSSQTVTITGLKKTAVTLKISDLKKMDCETIKAESTSDKIGKLRATGPWLDTVLKKYGAAQTDYSKIIFTASDGYDVKISKDFLKDNKIMLAYGVDKKALDADSAPCRIIIKDSDSAYWVRKLVKIQLVK